VTPATTGIQCPLLVLLPGQKLVSEVDLLSFLEENGIDDVDE